MTPPLSPIALAKAILQWVEVPTPELARQIEQALRRMGCVRYTIPGCVEIRYAESKPGGQPAMVMKRIGEGLMYG